MFIVAPSFLVSAKPSLDNSLIRNKNYNKVIDESMITQMSAGDLGKLRNNLHLNSQNVVSQIENYDSRQRMIGQGGKPVSAMLPIIDDQNMSR